MSKKQWTKEQATALDLSVARLAITADAGAGKTSVLVQRVSEIVSKQPAARVLCVSFTEKSKADLEERLYHLPNVEVYTIHGFCSRIVTEFSHHVGLPPLLTILDQQESNELLLKSFERLYKNRPPEIHDYNPNVFLEMAKLSAFSSEKIECFFPDSFSDNDKTFVDQVVFDFQEKKKQLGFLDYSDLERFAVKVLDQPLARELLTKKYRYVFVDEFQDTSEIQCSLVRNLTSHQHQALFVVGDSKQSIYGFRGADVEVFESFIKELPIRRLSQNFRSHPEIIQTVNQVGSKSIEGYLPMKPRLEDSKLLSDEVFSDTPRVARLIYDDLASAIRFWIDRLEKKGVSLTDVVLLMPRIARNDKLFVDLEKLGINIAASYSTQLTQNPDFLSLVNLWIFVCEPWQRLRFAQVLVDYPGLEHSEWPYQDFFSKLRSFKTNEIKIDLRQGVLEFLNELDKKFFLKSKHGSVFNQFEMMIAQFDIKGFLPGVVAQILKAFEQQTFQAPFTLIPPPKQIVDAQGVSSRVLRTMTVHASKGLEFPVVFIADLKDAAPKKSAVFRFKKKAWLLPRDEKGKLDRTDPVIAQATEAEKKQREKESARLFYVALTRAQEALYVFDEKGKEDSKKSSKSSLWEKWSREGFNNQVNISEIKAQNDEPEKKLSAPDLKPVFKEKQDYRVRSRVGVTEFCDSIRNPINDFTDEDTLDHSALGQQELSFSHSSKEIKYVDNSYSSLVLGSKVHEFLENDDWEGLGRFGKEHEIDLGPFFSWKESELGNAIFGEKSIAKYKEYPFEWKFDHQILTGRIDLLVLWEKEIWVVDYKLIKLSPGKLRSKQSLLLQYTPQVDIYMKAVKKLAPSHQIRGFLLDVASSTGEILHEVFGEPHHN